MIQPIALADIEPFKQQAIKSGLSFCKSTKYFAIYKDSNIVGFAGLIYQSNKIIIKNIWVPTEYRGNGYFKELIAFFLQITKGKLLEANCTKMSVRHFLNLGFKQIKLYKNGVTQVRYENLS